MAILTNLSTNAIINLQAVHQFGRHQIQCATILEHPKASRVHATMTWDDGKWSIQDNSVNGTFVNNQRLAPNILTTLKLNDVIHFVSQEHGLWKLTETSAPKSMLLPESSNAKLIILEDIVVLPDEHDPKMTLYLSLDGKWICENAMGSYTLTNNNLLSVQAMKWRFIEATTYDQTIAIDDTINSLSDFSLIFKVSQDEEHVEIYVKYQSHTISLGQRSHHYLMLLLAREYLENKQNKFEDIECGWICISDLIDMLQMDEIAINMQIYRFRKQLLNNQPSNCTFPQIIERRKGLVRLCCDNIQISGGAKF